MPSQSLHLGDFLDPSRVCLNLSSESKPEALRELVAMLDFDARSAATILRTLLRRENMGSTSIGRGIAVPHCRTPIAKQLQVAYGRRLEGILDDPIDGAPVVHLFLLVAPPVEVSNDYLPVLGRIAQFAKEPDVPARLAAASTPEDFLRILAEKSV